MSGRPILVMAGGTGGHVYPALAVARALESHSQEIVWLGTHRGLESTVIPAAGIDIEWISVKGLRRKGLIALVVAPFQLAWALLQSLIVILRRRPVAVLGMGGFVSGPGGLAAWLTRRPLVIHEQNAAAGLTNRLLARLARVVLQAFPGSFNSSVHAETVGNPHLRSCSTGQPLSRSDRTIAFARTRWQSRRIGAKHNGSGSAVEAASAGSPPGTAPVWRENAGCSARSLRDEWCRGRPRSVH